MGLSHRSSQSGRRCSGDPVVEPTPCNLTIRCGTRHWYNALFSNVLLIYIIAQGKNRCDAIESVAEWLRRALAKGV